MTGRRPALGAVTAALLLAVAAPVRGQDRPVPATSEARRMSVSWIDVPIRDVLRAFAAYSGTSIVAGANVSGSVTADINDQPWDVALRTILSVNGLVATEDEYGIISVQNIVDLDAREATEPLLTRSYRISYSRATEIQAAVVPLLSPRGSASVVESTNTLVVSDIARVQRGVAALLK